MPIRIKLYKDGKEILSRGAPCKDRCSPSMKPLEKNGYKLEILSAGTQAQTVKPFIEYIKERFQKNPEELLKIEELFLNYIKREIGDSRPKDIISKALNRIKNITGGVTALILEPFIVIRTSATPTGFKKPYKARTELEGVVAIPIEDYVRYKAEFKTEGISSTLVYLSVSEDPSSDFYRRLHDRIASLKNFYKDITEIIYRKNNKRIRLVGLFERAKEELKESLKSLPEVESVNIDMKEDKPFEVADGKVVPKMRLKIKLTQMPPALDTRQVEEASKKAVYAKAREVFYRVFLEGIPEISLDDVDRFIDISGIEVIVNM